MKRPFTKFFILFLALSIVLSDRIAKLMKTYGVSQEFIQAELDKGYTLSDLEEALQLQKEGKFSYQESVNKIHPQVVNLSRKVKSKIKSDLPEDELKANPQGMVFAAPYSVSLDNEQISTLSGSLSISATDFTLPGRICW